MIRGRHLLVPCGLAAALATIVFLGPTPSRAGNTVHPRTPVLWPDAPCIQTVDRTQDANFVFGYEIPAEDTLLSIDEFDDSRRHQFVGFCRQWPAGRPPPAYVSVYDLQRSIDAGFEDAAALDDPEATLETSVAWAGCWTRITADEERRPITFAEAAEPVIWDTSATDPGTWLVAGYTWEPPYNIWRRAPWVVRVLDDPQAPAQAALSLADTDDHLYVDETLDLQICVDAEAGSTLTLEWADAKPDVLEWLALESVDLDGSSELGLVFVPPLDSAGKTILLRASVEDYVGHALDPVIVFTGGDGDGDPTGDGDGDGDPGGDADTSGTDDGDDTGGDDPSATEGGGGCSIPDPPAPPWRGALLVLFSACVLRRRARP